MFKSNLSKNTIILIITIILILVWSVGAGRTLSYALSWQDILGKSTKSIFQKGVPAETTTIKVIEEESQVIKVVEKASPSVVSIIITKDLPKIEQFFGTPFDDFFNNDLFPFRIQIPQFREQGKEKKEIGGGTGFVVDKSGLIITNKHVVIDTEAEYTVLTNEGKKYPAKVVARDPFSDLAILKVNKSNLPSLELGDSSNLKLGQTVIAIGNALGEFRNTVSKGIISGLSRSITAGGLGFTEQLSGVIQTDAAINQGNSGGPLLNLGGQVIGISTAIAQGAQNIGFAIPINEARNIIESVKKYGKIIRPWLGVRYVLINEAIARANNLPVKYGALIIKGQGLTELAVVPGSPADKVGLVENDIILEFDKQKIDENHPLAKVIAKYRPGDEIGLKILSKGKEKVIKVRLAEFKE